MGKVFISPGMLLSVNVFTMLNAYFLVWYEVNVVVGVSEIYLPIFMRYQVILNLKFISYVKQVEYSHWLWDIIIATTPVEVNANKFKPPPI